MWIKDLVKHTDISTMWNVNSMLGLFASSVQDCIVIVKKEKKKKKSNQDLAVNFYFFFMCVRVPSWEYNSSVLYPVCNISWCCFEFTLLISFEKGGLKVRIMSFLLLPKPAELDLPPSPCLKTVSFGRGFGVIPHVQGAWQQKKEGCVVWNQPMCTEGSFERLFVHPRSEGQSLIKKKIHHCFVACS